jgi:hypothetical protein
MPTPWPKRADFDVAERPPLDRLRNPLRPDAGGWSRWRLRHWLCRELSLLDQLGWADTDDGISGDCRTVRRNCRFGWTTATLGSSGRVACHLCGTAHFLGRTCLLD